MFADGGLGEEQSQQSEPNQDLEQMAATDQILSQYKAKVLESMQRDIAVATFEPLPQIPETEPEIKDPVLQSIALLKLSYIHSLAYIVAGRLEIGIDELRHTRDFAEDQQIKADDEFEDLYYEINDLIKEILRLQKLS